jgi:hypothetical protein
MRRRWTAIALLSVTGCQGVAEVDFIKEYEELYCRGYVLCASDEMLRTVGERECHQYFRAQDYPDDPACRYDKEAAEACLANLSVAGCEDNDPLLPESCVTVYSECQYPRLPQEDGSTIIE